ncbi:MAG: succinate dehydrogenase assembly factor 4 [Stellaceae bacterium]
MNKTSSPPDARPAPKEPPRPPREVGGPPGPEPTRHGDWEFNGRCTDF